MATYTTRLNLKKPDPSDFYNIEDFNDNADKIDAKILRIDSDKASQVDAETGSDDTKWMSPLRVRQSINKLKASQSEAQTGTDDTKWMSPLRVRDSINALKASQTDAETGTDNTKWMTPLCVRQSINKIKATTAEAQAATNDTHWMTPSKTLDLIKGQKCSADDIIGWVLKSFNGNSGRSVEFVGTTSGTLGFDEGQGAGSTFSFSATVPLSTLEDDDFLGYIQSISFTSSGGSSRGGYTGNATATIAFSNKSFTVYNQTGVENVHDDALSAVYSFFRSIGNVIQSYGIKLSKADSFRITITGKRTDSNSSYHNYDNYNGGKVTLDGNVL